MISEQEVLEYARKYIERYESRRFPKVRRFSNHLKKDILTTILK